MLAPPDPKMRRAALAGSPLSQNSFHTQDTSLAARIFKRRNSTAGYLLVPSPQTNLKHSATTGALLVSRLFCDEYADVYGGALP